jgi:hypothetical protein
MGGTYATDNVVVLTIPEHAEAHHQLFLEHGHTADFVAWKMLSGQMDKEDAFLTILRSPERRARISSGMKGKKNSLGHKQSAETRARISAILIGNTHAAGNTSVRGQVRTPEQRAKISAARLGKKRGHYQKRIQ